LACARGNDSTMNQTLLDSPHSEQSRPHLLQASPQTRAGVWRALLFAALGLCPNACGGKVDVNQTWECGSSQPRPDAPELSVCSNGLVHRSSAQVQCTSRLPRDPATIRSMQPACSTDTDCNEKPNGFCAVPLMCSIVESGCVYGCTSDADCDSGHVCSCGDPVGRCVPSDCTQDSDCESSLSCFAGKAFAVNNQRTNAP
jgi:hypothetical protein